MAQVNSLGPDNTYLQTVSVLHKGPMSSFSIIASVVGALPHWKFIIAENPSFSMHVPYFVRPFIEPTAWSTSFLEEREGF